MKRDVALTYSDFMASKIEPDLNSGCWLWGGWGARQGYGAVFLRGSGKRAEKIYAHRLAAIIAYGEIPSGKVVMHTCDTPACVNPAHLRVGTVAENNADKMAKGRFVSVKGKKWSCVPGCRAKERHPQWGHRATHCKRGHEIKGENALVKASGYVKCRACIRLTTTARQRAKRLVESNGNSKMQSR